jgi:IS30 family transposase
MTARCHTRNYTTLTDTTDLSVFSQAKLSSIARQLNERPRKTLHFHTPAEMFAQSVAAIH